MTQANLLLFFVQPEQDLSELREIESMTADSLEAMLKDMVKEHNSNLGELKTTNSKLKKIYTTKEEKKN